MKKFVLWVCICFFTNSFAQEKKVNVQVNPALLSVAGDKNSSNSREQRPLFGVQAGIGMIFPFQCDFLPFAGNWFYNPMLLFAPGGQAYKSGDYVFGDCYQFFSMPNTIGYSYPIKKNQHVNVELGPSVNVLVGANNFNVINGDKDKTKIDIAESDYLNRVNLSGVIEASYTWELPRFDLSVGLKGDLGLTPTVSYEDFNGDQVSLRAQSLALTLEVSNPITDLLGKDKYSDYTNAEYVDQEIEVDWDLINAETTYDKVIIAFRRAREFGDKSRRTEDRDSSKYYADQSLEWIKKGRQWMNDGVNEWNDGVINSGVGPTSQKYISRYLSEIETRSQEMADSTWAPLPEIVEQPIETGDDPRDSPQPIAYGEEVDPPWIKWEGAFEPSQGVWQDDVNFVDKHTKQLTKVDDHNYIAELDMIANRWTGVFGVRSETRFMIKLKGTSTYSEYVPVKYQLKLKQNGGERIIWTESATNRSLPIGGDAGSEITWESGLFDQHGDMPIPETFKMNLGSYTLVLEALRADGSSTGIEINVGGNVVSTSFPTVNVVPVSLSGNNTVASLRALKENANSLAISCKTYMEQQFPVPVDAVETKSVPIENLIGQELGVIEGLITLLPYAKAEVEVRYDKLLASMIDKYATQSQVNPGSKVVVLLSDHDYGLIRDESVSKSVAFAPHKKVVFVREGENETSVAHELIHTFPHLWSRTKMIAQCDLNYHNSADNNYGWGCIVTASSGTIVNGNNAIMSSSSTACHITQCSYWNLLWNLQGSPDPELYLVRGFLFQDDSVTAGVMANTYEIMGEEDLEQGEIEPQGWGIVLRDESDKTIATFPFQPNWLDSEEEEPHTLVAFNHRVNRIKGTASISLVGPKGALATQKVSANAPKLKITSPAKNSAVTLVDGKLRVSWEGKDKDGDTLSYLVYYAPDGNTWRAASNEQEESSVDVAIIGKPMNPAIKVLATDGVRSDEVVVKFFIK